MKKASPETTRTAPSEARFLIYRPAPRSAARAAGTARHGNAADLAKEAGQRDLSAFNGTGTERSNYGGFAKKPAMCLNVHDEFKRKIFARENAMGTQFTGHRGGPFYRLGGLFTALPGASFFRAVRADRLAQTIVPHQGKEKSPV